VVQQLAALEPRCVGKGDRQEPECPERLDFDSVLVEERLAGKVAVGSLGPDEIDMV
jgi:hypothetical protein